MCQVETTKINNLKENTYILYFTFVYLFINLFFAQIVFNDVDDSIIFFLFWLGQFANMYNEAQ